MPISQFSKKVYEYTSKIPKGKVSTYAAIASAIGRPKAFRAVGQSLHNNPFAPEVPCHRVVTSDGRLGGFAGGLARKRKLLRSEGVKIVKDEIDLDKYGYKFSSKK